MKIDHIGYAVKRIDKAIEAFSGLGYVFGDIVDDTDRNLKIVFGEKDGYRIELVAILDKKADSPITDVLKRSGPTPYHICYVSDDIEADTKDLESKGFRVIIEPAEAIAFGRKKVVFLYGLSTGLMEIVEA